MDSSSIFEDSKISDRYSGLDESLRFVQSLVSHRIKSPEAEAVQVNSDNGYLNGTNEHQFEQDISPQTNGNMDDVEHLSEAHDKSMLSEASSHHNGLNVEDRLYQMNNVYKERRAQKLKAMAEEEKNKVTKAKPAINKKSEKMVKSKGDRNVKVEERLMGYAKQKHLKLEDNKSAAESSKNSTKGSKSSKTKNSEVVNRLMDYGKFYKQKKAEREEQFKKSQTFRPNIEKSNELVSAKSKYKNVNQARSPTIDNDNQHFLKYTQSHNEEDSNTPPIEEEYSGFNQYPESRLYDSSGFKEPTKKMKQIQDEYDKNHPFHPNINSTSKSICEKKTLMKDESGNEVHNRLYSLFLTKKKKEAEQPEFKPQLNKNSEEIIRLMREGDDYDKNDRWRSLYSYGVMKQKARKDIEDQIKEIREEEALSSQPYRPQILPYHKHEEEPKDVVDRTKEWAASLECKKEVLAESYFQNQYLKELQECTFQPRLIAEEKLKERNITTSELSSRVDIGINPKSLESFYKRMQEAHYRKRELEDYEENFCGSGKNWQNKLTLPTIPDFHEKKQLQSLEQVKCLTKPVVRNGEIVRDPLIQINRHDKYKKSDLTNKLRGDDKVEEFEVIRDKNVRAQENLFDENADYEDCVDFLHNQISELDI